MARNKSNRAGRVEKVDGRQAQDSRLRRPVRVQRTGRGFGRQVGRVFGFGVLSVLILAALLTFSTSSAYAQGAGKALDFDGADDYVDVADDASLDITGAITVELWVKPSAFEAGWNYLAFWDGTWSIEFGFVEAIGKPTFKLEDVAFYGDELQGNEGQWYHIAGVRNGNFAGIYVNGVLKGNTNIFGTADLSLGQSVKIGGDGGTAAVNGTIDEFRIWSVARTETEIRDNMCKKLTGSETGLVGYWRFDESSGTNASDETINSNDGTLTNMTDADWVTSTAPIGDASAYQYSATPSVTLTNGNESFKADNFSSDPTFAHVYRIEAAPNYTTANSPLDHVSQNRYWGVFVGSSSPTYDVTNIYTDHGGIDAEANLALGTRTDPTVTSWSDAGAHPYRRE